MPDQIHIDLSSPQAQELLLGTHAHLDTGKKDVVRLAGDVPDPIGSGTRGYQSSTFLNRDKREVLVVFGDLVMTVDIYQVPGEPLVAYLYCPRCHKHLTVRADQKAIDYDPGADNPMRGAISALGKLPPELVAALEKGRLSIAPFECTWEVGDDKYAKGSVHTGAALCRLRLAIEDNRARKA